MGSYQFAPRRDIPNHIKCDVKLLGHNKYDSDRVFMTLLVR